MAEPNFNNFVSTNYRMFSRDSPMPINGEVQRKILANPYQKVGYMRTNLKQELRGLKVFTIIDKTNGGLEEIERDVVSLHNEMPKYFSKPRLFGQVLPEVLKNKKNMMQVLRGIKTREERRDL
jgi:hypothetical protein